MDLAFLRISYSLYIIYTFVIVGFFSIHTVQEFDADIECCNGTLGYANAVMPCKALKCCNSSEVVSVAHVNAALGFVFRCTSPSLVKECVPRGKTLISTNEDEMKYGARICCKGLSLNVFFNHPKAAFAVDCV